MVGKDIVIINSWLRFYGDGMVGDLEIGALNLRIFLNAQKNPG